MTSDALLAALTTWQFAPLAVAPAAALGGCYLAAAVTVSVRPRRGRPWPAAWTAAFVGGLAAIAVATQSWIAVHDDASLAAHMVQHLLLIMVAPPLLIAGRPVTLLLHVTRNPWHTWVKRLVRSRAVTALTCPPAGLALFAAAVLGTHLTRLIGVHGTAHDAEHVLYLVAGYLFFLPVIGTEPLRWRPSALGRYLLLLAAMMPDIATGAVLMVRGPLGPYTAADGRTAGVIMLAGSEAIMTVLALWLAVAVMTEDEKAFESG